MRSTLGGIPYKPLVKTSWNVRLGAGGGKPYKPLVKTSWNVRLGAGGDNNELIRFWGQKVDE